MVKANKNLIISVLIVLIVILGILLLWAGKFTGAVVLAPTPSACSGNWSYCTRAFADDASRATARPGKMGLWNNYGLSVPNSAIVDRVVFRADFFANRNNGYIDVQVSGDGGLTYGPTHRIGGNIVEQSYAIDVTNDLSWTANKLSDANLRVKATCVKQGSGGGPTCYLDWIPVNISYTPFDFTVSASPVNGSIFQGETSLSTITVSHLGGISQAVSLSHSGCPAGATCTFTSSSGNPMYKSNFTVATTSSTPAGIYPITISGNGDGKTRSITYTVIVNEIPPAFNFNISVSPSSGSMSQGGSISTTTVISLISGATETVSLSYSGCPSEATCNFTPSSENPAYDSTFLIVTTSLTPEGTYSINLTGTGGGKTRSTTYTLTITDSQPIAAASANPDSGSAPLTVSFTGSVSGGDTPLIYFWNFSDGITSTLQNPQHTFNSPGSYNVLFRVADIDGDVSSTNVLVSLTESFNFSIETSPTSGSIVQGNDATTLSTVTLLGGTTESVSLSSSGCPTGATCTFSTSSGNPTYSSTMTVATTSSTPTGTYPITITGTGGGVTRTAIFTLTVTAAPSFNFNVSLSPSSKSIVQGNSTTTSATISLVSGTTQSVSLSQSGCPTGATCTFSTSSGNPTYSSTMTVATTSSTPVGTYPITITGTGGGVTKTATFTLTVTAAPSFNFSVSLSPSSGNTSRGGSVSSTAFVTLISGTTQSVSLSQSGCPTGTTCTFNSSSGNPSFSSRFTVSTTNSTPTGVHNIIVSGTGGGLTRSGYYTLTVNP